MDGGRMFAEVVDATRVALYAINISMKTVYGEVRDLDKKARVEVLDLKNNMNNLAGDVQCKLGIIEQIVQDSRDAKGSWDKGSRSVVESKIVQNIKPLEKDKSQFRQLHQKLISAPGIMDEGVWAYDEDDGEGHGHR